MESHGIITPSGKKIKETLVKVENGMGTKTVVVEDVHGIHANTVRLNASEIRNIQKHKFMPGLFKGPMKNIKEKKANKSRQSARKDQKKSQKKSQKTRKSKSWFNIF